MEDIDMKVHFLPIVLALFLAGCGVNEYQSDSAASAYSTEAQAPSEIAAVEMMDFGIPVNIKDIPYGNIKCIAVGNDFYLIDDSDNSATLYKINELGEVTASTCLTGTSLRIRIKPMDGSIAVLTYEKIIVLDYSLNIIQEIELPVDYIGGDGTDYDIDAQLNYLYAGIYRLDLKTGESIELLHRSETQSAGCYRVVGDKLLCIEYYKDKTKNTKAVLFDLEGTEKTDVPFHGEDIASFSLFSLQHNRVPTFDYIGFNGVYNVEENSYMELNIPNQLVQEGFRFCWCLMNSQNFFYIDKDYNLVQLSLLTQETTMAGFRFVPTDKLWLLAANENNKVLYYTNSPDAGTIQLYIVPK